KFIQFVRRDARLAQTEIEWVVDQGLIRRAAVHMHRQKVPGRHGGAGRVELQLADRNTHAVCAQIAEAQNPPAGGETDHAHVSLWPVPQYLFYAPFVLKREIESSWPSKDMSELQARFRHRGVVEDRQEPCRIGHHHFVEER